jgi:hypothetical protein
MTIKPARHREIAEVMRAWPSAFGGAWAPVQAMTGNRALAAALFKVIGSDVAEIGSFAAHVRIGHWLSRNRNRLVGDEVIVRRDALYRGVRLWRIEPAAPVTWVPVVQDAATRRAWLADQITQTENMIAFYRQAGPGLRLKLSVCNDGREYGIETGGGEHCRLIGDEVVDALKRRARRLDAELRALGVTVDAAGDAGRQ